MTNEPLKQAIGRDDAQAALAILNQQALLLNEYCLEDGYAFTPVGYAAYYNKLKCLDAISSMAGVDFSRGEGEYVYGALYLVLLAGHTEAAKILARKGAACTREEIGNLGEKYTNFQQIIQQENTEVNGGAPVQPSTEEVEQAESQSIAFLDQKEEESLAKLQKKMQNPYFMEDLDQDDVSTVFSLFNMDLLFPKYKQHDQFKNLEVTASTAVETLQKDLKLEFSEAAELLWKLKLLEVGERGCARHLSKCSICSSTTAGALLQEYGMKAEEREKIEAKMKGWKGFYFAAANAASAAAELNVGAELAPKLGTCWMRIQKAHKWEHPDD